MRLLYVILMLWSMNIYAQTSPYPCIYRNDTLFYANNHILGYGLWRGDTLDGHWKFFDEKGRLGQEGNFDAGTPIGTWWCGFTSDLSLSGRYLSFCKMTRQVFTEGFLYTYTYTDGGWGFDDEGPDSKLAKKKRTELVYGLAVIRRIGVWSLFSKKENRVIEEKRHDEKGNFIEKVILEN